MTVIEVHGIVHLASSEDHYGYNEIGGEPGVKDDPVILQR